ncbi:hypothetical protein D3C72_2268370 [compost metagenome]
MAALVAASIAGLSMVVAGRKMVSAMLTVPFGASRMTPLRWRLMRTPASPVMLPVFASTLTLPAAGKVTLAVSAKRT